MGIAQMTPVIGAQIPAIRMQYANGGGGLPTIPENRPGPGAGGEEDLLKAMKNQAGGAKGGPTYQFNKTAHRKYNSQKSLFERILKSHSEGNRFIGNDDL